jgi:hypothetical protein
MNFGEVLTRAWEIIWKHKVLWIFGLLASLAGGGENSVNWRMDLNDRNVNIPFGNFERVFEQVPFWLPLLIFMAILVIVVVLIVLGTIGRSGLVHGAWRADEGVERLTFSQLFNEGMVYFWRVLLLGIIIWAVGLAVVMALTIPAVLTLGLALLCLWPLYCLLIPFFYLLNVVFNLAIVAVVGENRGIMDGLSRGWEVFRSRMGEIIVMSLVLVIGVLIVNFIISLPMLLVAAPLAAAVMRGGDVVLRGGLAISAVLFLLYLPILLAASAIVRSYMDTAWTLIFRRATGRAAGAASMEVIDSPAAPLV